MAEHILEQIIDVVILVGVPTIFGTLIAFIIQNQLIKRVLRMIMKREIMKVYYLNDERGWVWDYEAQNAEEMYQLYRALKGNHYVEKDVMPTLENAEKHCSRINF